MHSQVRVLQGNGVLGDWDAQVQHLAAAAAQAQRDGVRCLLPSAFALCGSPVAGDYVLRPDFLAAAQTALEQLVGASTAWPDVALVLSHPGLHAAQLVHAVSVVRNGRIIASGGQQHLGADAPLLRHYTGVAASPCLFTLGETTVAVLPGQDALTPACAQAAVAAGAGLLLALPVQAFYAGQPQALEAALAAQARAAQRPLISSHPVGGYDHWVFAGASLACNARGETTHRLESFIAACADMAVDGAGLASDSLAPVRDELSSLWHALVLAVRDYVQKNRFPGALLGLSGGIDSALVLAIAVDALGPQRVRTVMMPSPYTADISWLDAQTMADGLGVRHDVIHIAPQVQAFEQALAPLLAGTAPDTTEENLQARCRGTLLMALSNKFGPVVLTTSNKARWPWGTAPCTVIWPGALRYCAMSGKHRSSPWPAGAMRTTRSARAGRRFLNASSPARPAPSCAPTRRTRTACRPTRCSMPCCAGTWSRAPALRSWRRTVLPRNWSRGYCGCCA